MLTVAGQVVLAEEARAARNRKRHNDAISALKLGHAAACFLDDSHELVPERHRPRLRKKPVVDVQVRAADRGGRDAQNHVVRFLDRRVWNGIDGDFAGCVEDECFHSEGTIELAVELRRRRKAAFAFRTPAFRSAGKSFCASFALSSSYSSSVAAASEFTADSASSVSFASVSFSSLSVSSRRSAKSSWPRRVARARAVP